MTTQETVAFVCGAAAGLVSAWAAWVVNTFRKDLRAKDMRAKTPTARRHEMVTSRFEFAADVPSPAEPCTIEEITEPLEVKVWAAAMEDSAAGWRQLIATGRMNDKMRDMPFRRLPTMVEAQEALAETEARSYDPTLRPRLFRISTVQQIPEAMLP